MPTCTTPLRDDLCAFCRHPSLNESNDNDDKKKKERIKNDFNTVCPACLNCFSFFSCRSSAPSKTASEDKEEEEDNNNKEEDKEDKDKAVVVSDARELAKHLACKSKKNTTKRRKRVVQNGERVCVDFAFPPSVAFRQALAKEILLREGKEGKEGEDVIDSDEEKESVNMARIQQQQRQQQMRVLEGDFDAMAREAREAAMLMVRAHSGCERVEHVRDKAKATVMVYVEYEGVPSAASFATDKKSDFNNEDGERDDGTIQTTNVSLEDDFKAMRHFNVKRPNDRQKNWKKRKRREGRKPEWELVLSQPEPKYLAAFEDSLMEYSRVRKETSTDGFLRAIKNATTET